MKHVCFILFFFCWQFCGAQNLVPNGSFEDYVSCPSNLGQIYRADGWNSVRGTSDYFNSCAPVGGFNSPSVPHNYWGYQTPASGNAYAGFGAVYGLGNNREYLGASLLDTLVIGTRYFASFKVSLFYKDIGSVCGMNKLGVLFSTSSYSDINPAPVCNCAQIFTDLIISDTLNWVTVKGSFIADSNYTFISIGNFFVDSLTDSIQIQDISCRSYYYLDDVCISTDSVYCADYTYVGIKESSNPASVHIYPNPAFEFIKVELTMLSELYDISIYDDLGRVVFYKQNVNNAIEHIPIDGIESNFLFIKIKYRDDIFYKK